MTHKAAILGISALGHDAAASLVDAETGEILFAIAEERLTNLKHTSSFPIASICAARDFASKSQYTVEAAALNIVPEEFSTGTLRRELERLLPDKAVREPLWAAISQLLPFGDYFQDGSFSKKLLAPCLQAIAEAETRELVQRRVEWYYNWSVKYRWLGEIVRGLLPGVPLECVNHHLTHAISAYFNSGFRKACVLTWDGQGESQTVCVYRAEGRSLNLLAQTSWPTSLGILYLGVTTYLGFKLGDEFKVMGMSAYGKPVYYELFRDLLKIGPNLEVVFASSPYYGHKEFDEGHFWNYFTDAMKKLVPERRSDGPILQAHFDLAASLQKAFEDFGAEFAQKAMDLAGLTDLCIAGGVALNGLMNEAIRRRTKCRNIFVFPAAGDDGCSVGAAQYLALSRGQALPRALGMPFLGGGTPAVEIRELLQKRGVVFEEPEDIHLRIAQALVDEKIVARFSGRSEFGPRALGNRSILASAHTPEMKDVLNTRIKHREQFRPFAPACLLEHVGEYFDIEVEAPFMLLIANAREIAQKNIPAAVHADGTSRVQTVNAQANPNFYRTIKSFHDLTGVPAIINTSFNINGEAIVETALDALESFAQMDIDYLALEGFWIDKTKNPGILPVLTDAEFLQLRKDRFHESCRHPLKNLEIYHDYFRRGDQRPVPSPSLREKIASIFR